MSDFGGLFLFESPQIEVEPPSHTEEPPRLLAHSDVSPEGVVGPDVVGDKVEPPVME